MRRNLWQWSCHLLSPTEQLFNAVTRILSRIQFIIFFYVGFLLTVDNNLFDLKVRRREELWRLLLGGEI